MKIPKGVRSVSDQNFRSLILQNPKKVLLICMCRWHCESVHMVQRELPKFVARYGDKIDFFFAPIEVKRGVKKNPGIEAWMKVQEIPTIIGYENGVFMGKRIASNIREYEARIQDIIDILQP